MDKNLKAAMQSHSLKKSIVNINSIDISAIVYQFKIVIEKSRGDVHGVRHV